MVSQLAGLVAVRLRTQLEAATPLPAAFALMAALIRSFGPAIAGAGMAATDQKPILVGLLCCNQHCADNAVIAERGCRRARCVIISSDESAQRL